MNVSELDEESKRNQNVRVIFLGDMGVGKTSIIYKFKYGTIKEPYNPTTNIDVCTKNIIHKKGCYRLTLWDTAGQEKFRSLISSFLKSAQCGVITFNVADRQSFENVRVWYSFFQDNRPKESMIVLLANKIDLPRIVSRNEGQQLAKELRVSYFQVSATKNIGIESFFQGIVDQFDEQKAVSTECSVNHPQNIQKKIVRNNSDRQMPTSNQELTAPEGCETNRTIRPNKTIQVNSVSRKERGCCYI